MYTLLSSLNRDAADPFPLQTKHPAVAALLAAGHVSFADRLSYELNAVQGNSLTSAFNRVAGGDLSGEIAANRKQIAARRVEGLLAEARELVDWRDDSDNDGGGAPPAATAMPERPSAASAFNTNVETKANPAPEPEPVPAVSTVPADDKPVPEVPRPPWGKLLGGK